MYKLGSLPDCENDQRFLYNNIWGRQTTSGVDRLAIAPRSGYVALLRDLAACLEEPFLLLYVLVVPRSEASPGRYQSEYSFDSLQLRDFLNRYGDFLEQDARHNLWIRSASGNGLLVYDRHNIIYAYGPIEAYVEVLNGRDLVETAEVCMPKFAHSHHYHPEFDDDANHLLDEEKWIWSPLKSGDENPC